MVSINPRGGARGSFLTPAEPAFGTPSAAGPQFQLRPRSMGPEQFQTALAFLLKSFRLSSSIFEDLTGFSVLLMTRLGGRHLCFHRTNALFKTTGNVRDVLTSTDESPTQVWKGQLSFGRSIRQNDLWGCRPLMSTNYVELGVEIMGGNSTW